MSIHICCLLHSSILSHSRHCVTPSSPSCPPPRLLRGEWLPQDWPLWQRMAEDHWCTECGLSQKSSVSVCVHTNKRLRTYKVCEFVHTVKIMCISIHGTFTQGGGSWRLLPLRFQVQVTRIGVFSRSAPRVVCDCFSPPDLTHAQVVICTYVG